MRTRRSNYPNNSNVTIPRRRRRQVSNIVEPEIRTIVTPMAERTMEELLRAPTEGYGEAIVLPEINADHFEIKTNLLQLVQANPFNGRENENPHAHINSFKRITSTLRFRNVPNDIAPTILLPKKVVERGTEETRIKSKQNSKDIVYQLNSTCGYPHFYSGTELLRLCLNPLHSEIDIRKESNLSQNISYPSRRDDQKSRDKASIKWRRSSQIFLDLRFETLVSRLNTIELALLGNASQKASRKAWQIPAKLADRSITYPKGLAEDVFVKVGKFYFPTDFVVIDFEADPRVPLILGRSFLRTGRALIDVYGEEITLRVDNEAVTFNLYQTTRYSFTNDKSVNRIDIIDAVCEKYALEFLGFPNSWGGNPTPTSKPFTSEFILGEIEAYLKDDSISPEIDHADYNPEEDICLIEKLLNNDPFQLPSMDLKQSEVTEAKSSIEEPPELELKDLPSHLEYAFLEENNKLPVIIAKGLKDVEKDALLKVLKSHKRAIAWKITDIKGIDPRLCTHKILREDDYKPTVQIQRRVNPKIHEVIKKEVLKLLDA
ncbi:reverse transcriptase domain-containing protein, partial [Tanacetum coccineum]